MTFRLKRRAWLLVQPTSALESYPQKETKEAQQEAARQGSLQF